MFLDQFKIREAVFGKNIRRDKPAKSLIKAISWRVIGTMDTIAISWLITGELIMAFSIGSVEVFSKLILFFFHERLWSKI